MADLSSLHTNDTAATSAPRCYRIIQDGDRLEIRAYDTYESGAPPYTSAFTVVTAFLSNQETHLYGECYLEVPTIRHLGTLSVNEVTGAADIVVFSTGASSPAEVLSITEDGWVDKTSDATRTAYVSVHASAFFRNMKGQDNSVSGLLVTSGAYSTAHLATEVTNAPVDFCADFPCRIPDGAVITSVSMLYQVAYLGTEGTNRWVKVYLNKTDLTDNTGTNLLTLTSGTGSGSLNTATGSLSEQVDYMNNSYNIQVSLRNLINGGTSHFYALRITYTYTKVGDSTWYA